MPTDIISREWKKPIKKGLHAVVVSLTSLVLDSLLHIGHLNLFHGC